MLMFDFLKEIGLNLMWGLGGIVVLAVGLFLFLGIPLFFLIHFPVIGLGLFILLLILGFGSHIRHDL